MENLDAMNGGVVGVFIAPTTKLAVWWRLSVAWCTGQSGAPDQDSLRLSFAFLFEPVLGLFIGLC